MITPDDLQKIKVLSEEFFQKMAIGNVALSVDQPFAKKGGLLDWLMPDRTAMLNATGEPAGKDGGDRGDSERASISVAVNMDDPQVLIGQNGQTLFDIQRILGIILNKNLKKIFYLQLDINEYKQKKIEHLKKWAKELADEVSLVQQEKALPPMPAYERRIIHAELSGRADVATRSEGSGPARYIVITPSKQA